MAFKQNEVVLNYEVLSEKCADVLIKTVAENPAAKIVLATGGSPLLGYRKFVQRVKETKLDVSKVTFIKLDEWLGLRPDDPATCEHFIRQEILNPLGISDSAYIGFDSRASDPEAECTRIEKLLEALKPIDLMVLGVGRNGHLGLNEPADYLYAGPHTIELDEKTKQHAMLTNTTETVQRGITLGIKDILCSKTVLLLVSGEGKKEAYREICKGTANTRIPATMLNLHDNVICIIEQEISK